MDPYNVYLCNKEITHHVIVSYYGAIYSDFLEKFVQAGSSQPLNERHNREIRKPNVAQEVIPSLLKPCSCGGRFIFEWSQFCRTCVTQKVFDDVGVSIDRGALTSDDVWVGNVVEQIRSLASTWEVNLDTE